VCRPGGVVAARDADYSRFHLFPRFRRWIFWPDIYQQAARSNGGDKNRMPADACCRGTRGRDSTTFTPTGSLWCYATPANREWWGGMWLTGFCIRAWARELLTLGLATAAQLEGIAAAWRAWAAGAGWMASDAARRNHFLPA